MAWARFGAMTAYDPADVVTDIDRIDGGFWAVVIDFESTMTAIRFTHRGRRTMTRPPGDRPWTPLDQQWRTSLDHQAYVGGVTRIRELIAAGEVYQVNLCRILSHDLPDDAYLPALARLLRRGNPAPYEALIHAPELGVDIVCASPERYLWRGGERVVSSPIKGTAVTAAEMLPKDYAENVMIADLVRNDLQHVCEPGSVVVEDLCGVEAHPGLVHLVTNVAGRLCRGVSWRDVLDASFPPGSVSGAPKSSALTTITALEPVPRGPYCGAIGWIDADRGEAELAVGIRTFWATQASGRRVLNFGAGAGITWGSDPQAEWQETQLKARRLIGLASGGVAPWTA
ncbi:MAG TPA: chorismate-binding protein [Tetrasphaera sp.]|uniref:chorismate-binding protein n=1 Tax=Nostocoides sp. TaxID=1917966 RepID=UPI002D1D3AB0|nr:chorismate-binding protein [Tetrasphaera sp.]HNQ05580.1 chorismate-binding protein [Tetrasphaera sp.]